MIYEVLIARSIVEDGEVYLGLNEPLSFWDNSVIILVSRLHLREPSHLQVLALANNAT